MVACSRWLLAAAVSAAFGLAFAPRHGAAEPLPLAAGQAITPAASPPRRPAPIPPRGPLSRPQPSDQVGLPARLKNQLNAVGDRDLPAKVALGERLFFEGRLSADGSVACATCHDPRRAFTDGLPTSIGVGGRLGRRNSPTIMNAAFDVAQFWDGRVATLEAQAALPIVNPVEMGASSLAAAVAAIASDPEYKLQFRQAFGCEPNATDLVSAIAAYERTQISYDTPFDRFIAGAAQAIDDRAKRGWQLFNHRGRCNKCHALDETVPDPSNFTDDDYHDIGIGIVRHEVVDLAQAAEKLLASVDTQAIDRAALQSDLSALGRFLVTKKLGDVAAFKTPNLRNVLLTAPYFHDGSAQTLWDVIDHYNKGAGLRDPWLDEDIQPLALAEGEIDDLVAFMASLTSPPYAALGRTELARQRAQAQLHRPQRDTQRAFGPKQPRPRFILP